ncbi:MAG: tripartite tricarboxylate transporter substrate binding protein [Nitrospinota bacterium]|jgi:tripartite-type tricarboxylate transporter receptor subunit TctC|nr:tripartite tricarboxylate transporter substrate binding protein [Nitrospinota bacterium]MDP7505676.1 tripartite tricarboxylate transporter substrate binding protein [Nitrospinota bacterium]MDP7661812.1 tripartite tricarboxylate transporter substrate binding protein [Nitrospinota bacterium]
MNRRKILWGVASLLAAALLLLAAPIGEAAKYPSKPIRVIVALGAGGSHDMHARAVSSVVYEYLGQPLVVQLMPGGGGKVGMSALLRSKPDGYTVVLASSSHTTIGPHVRNMGYDPLTDFIPVFQVNQADYMIVGLKSQPWQGFDQFLAAARKNPGKLSYGSSGIYGTGHLMILKLMADTGIKLKHIPFKGGGPGMRAMLGGHVDTAGGLPATGGLLGLHRAGKVQVLAVCAEKRNSLFPNVPTMKEKGVDFILHSWRTFMVPKGTPQDRIDILVGALKKVVKNKSFKKLLKKMGERPVPIYGAALKKKIRSEHARFGAIFKSIGVGKK